MHLHVPSWAFPTRRVLMMSAVSRKVCSVNQYFRLLQSQSAKMLCTMDTSKALPTATQQAFAAPCSAADCAQTTKTHHFAQLCTVQSRTQTWDTYAAVSRMQSLTGSSPSFSHVQGKVAMTCWEGNSRLGTKSWCGEILPWCVLALHRTFAAWLLLAAQPYLSELLCHS